MDGIGNDHSVLHLIARRMVERPVHVLLSSELVRALGRPDEAEPDPEVHEPQPVSAARGTGRSGAHVDVRA